MLSFHLPPLVFQHLVDHVDHVAHYPWLQIVRPLLQSHQLIDPLICHRRHHRRHHRRRHHRQRSLLHLRLMSSRKRCLQSQTL